MKHKLCDLVYPNALWRSLNMSREKEQENDWYTQPKDWMIGWIADCFSYGDGYYYKVIISGTEFNIDESYLLPVQT